MIKDKNVLILGASGGIGKALVEELLERYPYVNIFATYRDGLSHVESLSGIDSKRVSWFRCDFLKETDIQSLSEFVFSAGSQLHLVINAVGLLHTEKHQPEKSIKQVESDYFIENIRTNTLPTLLLAKMFQLHVRQTKDLVFAIVSAKVGSIEDNRLGGWTSYRCSKAALNMAIKNISLEWKRVIPNACVVALHPGTTDSKLSLPFQANVPKGKLFSSRKTAAYLLSVIESLNPGSSGKFYSWDGSEIPW